VSTRMEKTVQFMLTNANGDLVDQFPFAEEAKASLPGVSWLPGEPRERCWNGWLAKAGPGLPDYVITFVRASRGGFRRHRPGEVMPPR
jgi:hypothetical protein